MKLPEPLFEIEYLDKDGHFYRKKGEEWQKSVTHYTGFLGNEKKGQALIGWAKSLALKTAIGGIRERLGQKVEITEDFLTEIYKAGFAKPKEALEAAGDVGTRAHAAIDDHIMGRKPDLSDPIVQQVFVNFHSWVVTNKYNIISGDIPVVSLKYGYGGRVDCIMCDDKDNIVIGDWKTSNSILEKVGKVDVIRAEYALQCVAYGQAVSESYGLPFPKTAWVVRFDKTKPDFQAIEVKHLKRWLKLFVAVRNLEGLLEKARS